MIKVRSCSTTSSVIRRRKWICRFKTTYHYVIFLVQINFGVITIKYTTTLSSLLSSLLPCFSSKKTGVSVVPSFHFRLCFCKSFSPPQTNSTFSSVATLKLCSYTSIQLRMQKPDQFNIFP